MQSGPLVRKGLDPEREWRCQSDTTSAAEIRQFIYSGVVAGRAAQHNRKSLQDRRFFLGY